MILALAFWCILSCGPPRSQTIVVGSKNFSESALLGEILAQHIEAKTHLTVVRRFYLAGSYICQQALLSGRIDVYVEYTGTALSAILKEPIEQGSSAVFARVQHDYKQRFNLDVTPSLGFNNTFALVVRGSDARHLHLKTVSDAVPYAAKWRAGFGYEFMERPDGYEGLSRIYGLHFAGTRTLDLGLLYRALLDNQVDLVAGNSTDGILSARDLTILEDDKHYFPPYDAVPVVRDQTLASHPAIRNALVELAGKISDAEMRAMDYAVDGRHRDAAEVAHEFLSSKHLD